MTHTSLNKNEAADVTAVVHLGLWIKPTGSRVTKSGWSGTSDYDYVVFDPEDKLSKLLAKADYKIGGSQRPEQEFTSYVKGSLNFIVTSKADYFQKYCRATELIKTVDAKTKEERIKMFDIIFGVNDSTNVLEF